MCLEGVLILKWVIIQSLNVKVFFEQKLKKVNELPIWISGDTMS